MNLKWIAVIAVFVMASGVALAQDAPAEAAVSPASDSNTHAPVAPVSQVEPTYIIGPDDVLHIAVWKETDLTATEPVRADGQISLPLLNDVQAAGLTPMQLADSLTAKLKKFVADPHVTVVVTAINSKRIYLIGEVLHTGGMPLLPNMTVLQALSSAGLNQFAKTKGIYVLRTVNGKQEKLAVNYRKLVKGQEIEENYVLQSGDTIVIP